MSDLELNGEFRAIVIAHTKVGGYPDTLAIARDAYNLGVQTSIDCIEKLSDKIIIMTQRPGGPPGNFVRPIDRSDIIAYLKQLLLEQKEAVL